MNVAVLCGGRGTRLGHHTQKCLIPVAGRPFLHWRLDQLLDDGATRFYLLVSHYSNDVIKECGHNWNGVPILYIHDDGDSSWGAVRGAADYIPSRSFFVANGDTIIRQSMHPIKIAPTRLVSTQLTEPPNVDNAYLDAGLYKVSRSIPTPIFWIDHITSRRTFTINTPEQWEITNAHFC